MTHRSVYFLVLGIFLMGGPLGGQTFFPRPISSFDIQGLNLQSIQSNNSLLNQSSVQYLTLPNHLKSKYLGRTIQYIYKKRRKEKTGVGEVVEIILTKRGYAFVLQDKTRVKVKFMATGIQTTAPNERRAQQYQAQSTILQTQAFINASLSSINSPGGSTVQEFPVPKPPQPDQLNRSFAEQEEIIYTDIKGRAQKGKALATSDSILLLGGQMLEIIFEREKRGKK